jgi:hypothetical protein
LLTECAPKRVLVREAQLGRLLSIVNDFEDGRWRQDKFDNFVWDLWGHISATIIRRVKEKGAEGIKNGREPLFGRSFVSDLLHRLRHQWKFDEGQLNALLHIDRR